MSFLVDRMSRQYLDFIRLGCTEEQALEAVRDIWEDENRDD